MPCALGLSASRLALPGILAGRAEHRQGSLLRLGEGGGEAGLPPRASLLLRALGGGMCVGESTSSAEQPRALKSARFILAVATLGNSRGKFHF